MTTLQAVATPTVPTNGNTPHRRVLTRERILGAKPQQFKDVPADEWEPGSVICVKPMDYETRSMWQFALLSYQLDKNVDALKDVAATAVARCIVDDDGKPQFTDADIKALCAKDGRPIDRAWDAIVSISKITDLDKQIEDVAKNSDNSPSSAPSTS